MKRILSIITFLIVCSFSVLLSGCGETPAKYEIEVLVNGANFGTVEDVSGTYTENSNITIKAKPFSGETFFCWIHDGKVVSINAEYTFSLNEQSSGTYIALFNCPDLEYFYLDSLSFVNNIATYDGEIEQSLKQISLNFGYSLNQMYNVLTLENETLPTLEQSTLTNDLLYANNTMPFTFDKTKDLYINVKVVYTKLIAESEIEFISETSFVLRKKDIGIAEENKVENLLDKSLNLTKCTINELVLETINEDLTYNQNKISLLFKELKDFNFASQEDNAE